MRCGAPAAGAGVQGGAGGGEAPRQRGGRRREGPEHPAAGGERAGTRAQTAGHRRPALLTLSSPGEGLHGVVIRAMHVTWSHSPSSFCPLRVTKLHTGWGRA